MYDKSLRNETKLIFGLTKLIFIDIFNVSYFVFNLLYCVIFRYHKQKNDDCFNKNKSNINNNNITTTAAPITKKHNNKKQQQQGKLHQGKLHQ